MRTRQHDLHRQKRFEGVAWLQGVERLDGGDAANLPEVGMRVEIRARDPGGSGRRWRRLRWTAGLDHLPESRWSPVGRPPWKTGR
jgi:hypothetical protein